MFPSRLVATEATRDAGSASYGSTSVKRSWTVLSKRWPSHTGGTCGWIVSSHPTMWRFKTIDARDPEDLVRKLNHESEHALDLDVVYIREYARGDKPFVAIVKSRRPGEG